LKTPKCHQLNEVKKEEGNINEDSEMKPLTTKYTQQKRSYFHTNQNNSIDLTDIADHHDIRMRINT